MKLRKISDKLKYHNLFIKMFTITLISIVTVALLTWVVMLRTSEQIFMDTFGITNNKIISQINANLENMNNAVSMAASNVNENGEVQRFLTNQLDTTLAQLNSHYKVTQEMERIQSSLRSYPIAMIIIGENGNRHATDTTFWPPSYDHLSTNPITLKTIAEPRRLHFQIDEATLDHEDNDKAVIVASKALTDPTNKERYGVLYLAIKEEELQKFYSGFTSEGNDLLIIHRNGQVISSNIAEKIGQQQPELLQYAQSLAQQGDNFIEINWNGRQYLILSSYLPTYDMYLVNMIDKRVVLSQMFNVKTVAFVCIAIVIISLLIVFIVSRRITRSLTLLARQMSRVTRRNFGNYITVSGSSEIKEVGKAYNLMLDELNEYIEQLIKTQKDQRNAELSALQMQINPHFLYNTLASIKILVQKGDKEKATATIHALIELLQNTISNASETITVEKELQNLKNYVYINHVRYGDKINVSYFIDEECYHYELPKLIIQPFIENAFFHAFNGRSEGYIYIMIGRSGNNLVCEVVDNGVGFDMDLNKQEKHLKKSAHFFSGIGIRNVNDRLELLYGEGSGVEIISQKNEGTRVVITLPLSKANEITNL